MAYIGPIVVSKKGSERLIPSKQFISDNISKVDEKVGGSLGDKEGITKRLGHDNKEGMEAKNLRVLLFLKVPLLDPFVG